MPAGVTGLGRGRKRAGFGRDWEDANDLTLSPEARRILRHRLNRGPAAEFTATSANRKLAPVVMTFRPGQRQAIKSVRPFVSSTFAAIAKTCPDTCQFKRTADGPGGCFADAGFTRMQSVQLNRAAADLTPAQVISEECREIDRAFAGGPVPQDGPGGGGRALRLHVGGDAPDEAAARALGAAAVRWRARGGGAVWTYTHSWESIPREAWGAGVSVLASVDHLDQMTAARVQGYAPSIVVDQHPADGRAWRMGRWRVIPCPAETRATNCANCGLCLGGVDLYAMRAVIAFAAHGQHQAQVLHKLGVGPAVVRKQPRTPGEPRRCGSCGGHGHNSRTCRGGRHGRVKG